MNERDTQLQKVYRTVSGPTHEQSYSFVERLQAHELLLRSASHGSMGSAAELHTIAGALADICAVQRKLARMFDVE